jgi:ABC-2 type transport system permease protein
VNLGAQMAGVNGGAINWLAMSTHLQPLLRGLVSTTDIVWFVLADRAGAGAGHAAPGAERERG